MTGRRFRPVRVVKFLFVAGYVTHKMIADFAADKVNLKRDDVKDYRAQVARLRERLETHIKEHPDYGFVKSRHSGSVAKGTALKTVNDMDLAVYVKSADAPADERQLLDWMLDRLKAALKPLGLKDDQFALSGHCVTIEYKGSGLNVDVVPVIYEGEDDDVGYLITKDTGSRVKTSVTQHLQFIRARKSAQPSDFAQIVRLLKWWIRQEKRRDSNFRFKSFMVELICAHLADSGQSMKSYPEALEQFFAYVVKSGLKEQIVFDDFYSSEEFPKLTTAEIQIIDPVNADNNVASLYTSTQRSAIVEAAADALDALNEAAYADGKGRAVGRWQHVLGPSFKGD
jgi:tRNA nucleotidyltransferase (CCA-adding enzyme)